MQTISQQENKLPPAERAAVLVRTREQIAEDEAMQAAAEKRLAPNVTESFAVAQYRNAVATEKSLATAAYTENDRLAECYFWQGKFDLAARTAATHQKKIEYAEFANAMVNSRSGCLCPNVQVRQSGKSAKGTAINPRREIQRVFVGSLNQKIAFIRCDTCGRLFANAA